MIIHAYMYIHVGVCVHVPVEHDFNRNFGLFHKIHAHRIITAHMQWGCFVNVNMINNQVHMYIYICMNHS